VRVTRVENFPPFDRWSGSADLYSIVDRARIVFQKVVGNSRATDLDYCDPSIHAATPPWRLHEPLWC
jgi:hypothetical protein